MSTDHVDRGWVVEFFCILLVEAACCSGCWPSNGAETSRKGCWTAANYEINIPRLFAHPSASLHCRCHPPQFFLGFWETILKTPIKQQVQWKVRIFFSWLKWVRVTDLRVSITLSLTLGRAQWKFRIPSRRSLMTRYLESWRVGKTTNYRTRQTPVIFAHYRHVKTWAVWDARDVTICLPQACLENGWFFVGTSPNL